jgi:hypothetical protein
MAGTDEPGWEYGLLEMAVCMGGRSFLSCLVVTTQRKRHRHEEGALALFLGIKNITTLQVA